MQHGGPAGAAAVDPSLIGRVDHWYGKLEEILNLLAAFSIFALMIVGVVQIVGRTVFGYAIDGYIDWIEQTSIVYAMFGVAYCQRFGGHIRMELLLSFLKGRTLWAFEALAVLLALIIVAMLIDSTWAHFLRAWEKGDSTIDIRLPIWPSKLVVPIALSVLWLRMLLQFWGYLRLFADPRRRPVAVPVVETAEQMAQREIDEVFGKTGLAAGADERRL
ncbi:MAG: TRAP transporter small permease subunit [Reyranellaceae bacterium]